MGVLHHVRLPLIALASVWFFVASVAAQGPPSWERGTGADTAYAVTDIESMNLFNGNLALSLPLGISYPVGPDLSYSFSATTSSNSWTVVPASCNGIHYSVPMPQPHANAGFGWAVHLGKLQPPGFLGQDNDWHYISPDGASHRFATALHPGYPATANPSAWYTHDGTYLRLRRLPASTCRPHAGTEGIDCWWVESPNGLVSEFRDFNQGPTIAPRLVRIRDPFDNYVDIDYLGGGLQWRVKDSHNRQHTLTFAGPAASYSKLERLDVEVFGGGTASYDFTYETVTIDRQRNAPFPVCAPEADTITVDLLTRIEQPDGTYWGLSHHQNDQADVLSGAPACVRTPLDGEICWTYGVRGIPSIIGDDNRPPDFDVAYPVVEKEVYVHSNDGTPEGTWTYSHGTSGGVSAPGDPGKPCHHTTTVRDPLGHETVHYFSTSIALHKWSFGLPFTRCRPGAGYNANGPFLSQQVYDGTAAGGTLVRSIEVAYETSGVGTGDDLQGINNRLAYTKTIYHDDGNRFVETTYSDFDGLGHYRSAVSGGTVSSGDSRTHTTTFNPNSGTLLTNPSGATAPGSFVLPHPGSPWILDTYTEMRTVEDGQTAVQEFCFDTSTGFLSRARTLAGATRGPTDLLNVFVQESGNTGRVAIDRLYGGDSQTFMDGSYTSLCDMDVPSPERYRLVHSYTSGVLAKTTAVDPCDNGFEVELVDLTIDANTGFVSRSRDVADVETSFFYDTIGRLTSERPPQSGWVFYEHVLPNLGQPHLTPQVVTRVCNPGGGCNDTGALALSRVESDGLGRTTSEHISLPSGTDEQVRTYTYNALGWLTAVSVWNDSTKTTTYDLFDRFGRPGRITPHNQSPTRLFYSGDRLVTRELRIQTSAGLAGAFTTEITDNHGRLIEVCENQDENFTTSCPAGAIRTTYDYDVGHRLTDVCQHDTGASCGQTRAFVYDQRGFLTSERHPEIGPSGNGWIDYTYDARGNVLSRDLAGSEFDLVFGYDPIGRLIRVDENLGATTRPLKEWFYARNNNGNDRRRGKVVLAKRHNWVNPVNPLLGGTLDVTVSEAFTYEGRDGAVSNRQTRYSFNGTTYAFQTGFSWTPLGNPEVTNYPNCLHADCDAPVRNIQRSYDKGFLTEILGWVDRIDYQRGGMVHNVDHANGVRWTLTGDTDGHARPGSIGTTAGWNSSTYDYDGAGNIFAIGSQQYRYDRLSRMTSGQTPVGGSTHTQSASYDVYGNLTQLITHGATQNLPVNPDTNRLNAGSYDELGNLTAITLGGEAYQYGYDAIGMMRHLVSNTDRSRVFVYTASDERLLTFDCAGNVCAEGQPRETWTLRDLSGQLLRVWDHPFGSQWFWTHDYIHRDGIPV
ncbi:MAG: hypothetical protein AAGD38_15990, partial [Acidobacteriota bacterium]